MARTVSSLRIGMPHAAPAARPKIVVVRKREENRGFLTVQRLDIAVEHAGTTSEAFAYDIVERRSPDAAVVAAHFLSPNDGRRYVVLRSALRPPFALDGDGSAGILWELPAGLIEPGESPIAAAARELNEEIGTSLGAERIRPLGAAVIPVPAMIAERQHLFHVEIDPSELHEPTLDGCPLEEVGELCAVAIDDALALARAGELPDCKTELALRRLVEVLATAPSPGVRS